MGTHIAAGGSVPFTMVLCQAINNVDTLWSLPFRSHFQHTVCYQPWINDFQLHAGEFGAFPVQPLHTYSLYDTRLLHMRFNQYVSDALNVSGSHLVGFNRDLCYEYCPRLYMARCDITQNGVPLDSHEHTGIEIHNKKSRGHDDSNFFIPIPFSIEGDFQGGLSSPVSNINFKVIGQFTPPSYLGPQIFNTPWVAAFLIDSVIMIRPDPMSDSAKVIWSDRTVV
jgi:hypothetical protein